MIMIVSCLDCCVEQYIHFYISKHTTRHINIGVEIGCSTLCVGSHASVSLNSARFFHINFNILSRFDLMITMVAGAGRT